MTNKIFSLKTLIYRARACLVLCCISGLYASEKSISLFDAAKDGNVKIIQNLIAQGINVDATNQDGQTPLHVAVVSDRNNLNPIQEVIGHAARKNPLIRFEYKDSAIVRILIATGAYVNALDKDDMTPLDWACEQRYYLIFSVLTDNGGVQGTGKNPKPARIDIVDFDKP